MNINAKSPHSKPAMPWQGRVRRPVRTFLACAVFGLFMMGAMSWLVVGRAHLGGIGIGVGLLFNVVAMTIAGVGLARGYQYSVLGLCNIVTQFRLVMVSVLVVAFIAGAAQSWVLFTFAVIALSLDGVDGWLARRQNLASEFGARFDMEVDAALAIVLALLALGNGGAGGFVLLLGLPSYVFFFAKHFCPWLDAELPDLLSRKVVCVAQLSVLIAYQIPLNVAALLAPLTVAVAVALVWSFGRDIIWLARHNR